MKNKLFQNLKPTLLLAFIALFLSVTAPMWARMDAAAQDVFSINDTSVTASLHGLETLYVGIPVEGEIRFTLDNAVFNDTLFAADFVVRGLLPGLTAGAPRRVSGTLVTVPISGTPLFANTTEITITIPTMLAPRNIFLGRQLLPVSPVAFTLPQVYPSANLGPVRGAIFDLNPNGAMHRDIHIQLFANNQELRALMYRNYRLIEGVDFTQPGGTTFRVYTRFLRQLPVGEWPLLFNMHRGANPYFTLNIIDTREVPGAAPLPGAELDRTLLQPPDSNDKLIFISGAPPIRVATLGLERGRGTVRPVLQEGQSSLWIRADVLEYLAWRYPFAVLEAQTRLGTFRFPTYILDILRGAKTAISVERLEYDEVYVRIIFTDVSADEQINAYIQQTFPGGQVLSPVTDLTVELVRRSDRQVFFTVREFLRPFEWVQSIMPQSGIVRYGAFWLNAAAERLEFAPHISGGPNDVIIRSIFTGVHAIVNNGAIVNDVPWTHWGFAAAYTASQTGLIQVQGGNISPTTPMTRAEFAQLITFALQLGEPGFLPEFYRDVPATHWAQDAIGRAWYAGLLDGEAYFRPDEPILRGEAFSMVTAAIDRRQTVRIPYNRPLAAFFIDHWEIPAHQRRAAQTASDYGIFIGFPGARIGSNEVATRIQTISMVVELARVVGNLDE